MLKEGGGWPSASKRNIGVIAVQNIQNACEVLHTSKHATNVGESLVTKRGTADMVHWVDFFQKNLV